MKLIIDLQLAAAFSEIPTLAQFECWVTAALADRLQSAELTLRIVDEQESAHLNQQYRNKTGPTNILSFPFTQGDDGLEIPLLGDLVICAPLVAAEAKEQGKPAENHWAHLTVHGILHLLGYDHVEDDEAIVMENLETAILQELGYPDPYGDRE